MRVHCIVCGALAASQDVSITARPGEPGLAGPGRALGEDQLVGAQELDVGVLRRVARPHGPALAGGDLLEMRPVGLGRDDLGREQGRLRGGLTDGAVHVAENSVAALAAGRSTGTVYLESDCHVTADGDVVLFHDDDLQRVAGDPRPVAAVRTRELADIMSTRGGLAILPDVLRAFPDARFNLDVKADAAAQPVGALVARESDRVLLTSFSDRRREVALRAARDRGGEPATSAGSSTIAGVLAALAFRLPRLAARRLEGVQALQIPERHRGVRILSRRLLDVAHGVGAEVHVWTVNEPGEMRRLIDLGVDGIVTDRVDLAVIERARVL